MVARWWLLWNSPPQLAVELAATTLVHANPEKKIEVLKKHLCHISVTGGGIRAIPAYIIYLASANRWGEMKVSHHHSPGAGQLNPNFKEFQIFLFFVTPDSLANTRHARDTFSKIPPWRSLNFGYVVWNISAHAVTKFQSNTMSRFSATTLPCWVFCLQPLPTKLLQKLSHKKTAVRITWIVCAREGLPVHLTRARAMYDDAKGTRALEMRSGGG